MAEYYRTAWNEYGKHVRAKHIHWESYCAECLRLADAIVQAAGDLVTEEAV